MNSSTGDKEKVVKVKKIYQNINDAMGRAVAVYGPVEGWFINDANATAQTTRAGERLTEFMKLSKNCKMTKGCYNSGSGSSTFYEAILADGTTFGISSWFSGSFSIRFVFDIDGKNKGRNSWGYDTFSFYASNYTKYSFEPDDPGTYQYGASTILSSCPGDGCAKWIIDYDNMDYLKLDSSGKCPNGSVLNIAANPPATSCR